MKNDKDSFFRAIYLRHYEIVFMYTNNDLIIGLVDIVKNLENSNVMDKYGIECDYMKKNLIIAYSKLYTKKS
jgi:hypothetical protein